MSKFGTWLDDFFTKYKGMRRSVLGWIMFMISLVTLYLVFRGGMTEEESNVVLGLIGMLTVGTSFYTWTRSKDDVVD